MKWLSNVGVISAFLTACATQVGTDVIQTFGVNDLINNPIQRTMIEVNGCLLHTQSNHLDLVLAASCDLLGDDDFRMRIFDVAKNAEIGVYVKDNVLPKCVKVRGLITYYGRSGKTFDLPSGYLLSKIGIVDVTKIDSASCLEK